MKIINLTQAQFMNYAKLHSYKNFGQTVEYTRLPEYNKCEKLFLGLVDDKEVIHAAVSILINTISPLVKEAIAKDGFLIDYADFYLFEEFIKRLKEYLKKHKVTYLITDPVFALRKYNKKRNVIEENSNILDNFTRNGFIIKGYNSEFEKYDIVIENYNSINEIYNKFNRNTRRNIKDSINMGISLHKGSYNELDIFYEMTKKKKKNSLKYYQDLMTAFNTADNKMMIFFAKLNIHNFLVMSKKRYEKELAKNTKINEIFQKKVGKVTDKLYNKKIASDKLLNKCHDTLDLATKLNMQGERDIIVGTTAVIKNKDEIYFLIDGFDDKYRSIHSSHVLKWAIIKKFYEMGYNKFNLGEINNNSFNKENKYHGQLMYKLGFGGNIVEYPPNMLLVINKTIYNTYVRFKNILKK